MQGGHGEAEGNDDPSTPIRHGEGGAGQSDKHERRNHGVVGHHPEAGGHALGHRGDGKAEEGEGGTEQAIDDRRQLDQPVIIAREGEKDPHEAVEEQGGDHEEENAPGSEDVDGTFDHVLPGPPGGMTAAGLPNRRFAEIHSHEQAEDGGGEGGVDRPAHRGAGAGRPTGPAEERDHEALVEKCGPADHGEEKAAGFPAQKRLEDPRPGGLAVALRQGFISQSFVRPAGTGFGRAADDAIEQEEGEKPGAARGEGEDEHFQDHERGGEHDDAFASDHVGQRAGGNFQDDDDHSPDDIKQGVLLEGQPEVEEEDTDHRVVEPGVKENAEGDKEREVAAEGGGHGIYLAPAES